MGILLLDYNCKGAGDMIDTTLNVKVWCFLCVLMVTTRLPAQNVATFHTSANFGGTGVGLPIGEYPKSDLEAKGITDNSMTGRIFHNCWNW
jgi:hypothetical protein